MTLTDKIPEIILIKDVISESQSNISNDDEKKHIEQVIDNVINVVTEEKKLITVS